MHTIEGKRKLLHRVRRIRGQVEAVERALDEEAHYAAILQTIAACRGAIDGLMAEVMTGHIEHHLGKPGLSQAERARATDALVDVIRAYLK